MGQHRHRISNASAGRALCSLCGPVDTIIDNGAGRPACGNRVRDAKHRYKIKTKYGLSLEQWDHLLIGQSGRCSICRTPMAEPYVDHCHATGRVRGLLCRTCNFGLGMFADDVERLTAAIKYLQEVTPLAMR